jgi:hypothetical protein
VIQRSSDTPPVVFNAYLRSSVSMFVRLESDQTNFPIDRHASGLDASQLSYIPVALRYESQGVGLAELVSTLVVFFH